MTALMFAARASDPAILRALLPVSDARATDADGLDALCWAAQGRGPKSLEKVEALLPESNLNHEDASGLCALMHAARHGNAEAARRLLSAVGEERARRAARFGETAFEFAIGSGDAECAALFLPFGDARRQGRDGRTPLMRAITQENEPLIRILAPKSDLLAKSPEGLNAMDLARKLRDEIGSAGSARCWSAMAEELARRERSAIEGAASAPADEGVQSARPPKARGPRSL
jgi:ankyrin repeat protein